MTFAPRIRTYNRSPQSQDNPNMDRTGVTVVTEGRRRFAVATIRVGNDLIYLGSGSVEQCTKLYDDARAKKFSKRGFYG